MFDGEVGERRTVTILDSFGGMAVLMLEWNWMRCRPSELLIVRFSDWISRIRFILRMRPEI